MKAPSFLMWNKVWKPLIWSHFLANAGIYPTESLPKTDLLEVANLELNFNGQLIYGTANRRGMHLREQAEDEWLEHHPQSPGRLPEGSTKNPLGKMTEWNTAFPFAPWKQELHCIFTYSNITSTNVQNCFQENKNQTYYRRVFFNLHLVHSSFRLS